MARYAFFESKFECFYGLNHPKSGFPRVAGEGMLGKRGGEGKGLANRQGIRFLNAFMA